MSGFVLPQVPFFSPDQERTALAHCDVLSPSAFQHLFYHSLHWIFWDVLITLSDG